MKKLLTSLFICAFVLTLNAQNSAPQATTATAGTLAVTFSTNGGSKFSAAIYITDNTTNKLMNTLLYNTNNGDNSASDMTTWWSLIGSAWPSTSTKMLTNTDAVTGATLSTHYSKKVIYWGQTASIAAVADGTYKVNFEIVFYSPTTRRYYSGTFVKGPTASTSSVTATSGFSGISIAWTPASSTAVSDVELSKLYNVYPNPAITSIYASGNDIKDVQICSLAGKILLSSKEQKVNVSALPKGFYLAVIYVKDGMVVKKIEKL